MATGGWRPRVREWWLEFSGIGDVLGTLDRIGDDLERQTQESVRLRQEMVEKMRSTDGAMCSSFRRSLREEMAELKLGLSHDLGVFRADVKEELAGLKQSVSHDLGGLNADMADLRDELQGLNADLQGLKADMTAGTQAILEVIHEARQLSRE